MKDHNLVQDKNYINLLNEELNESKAIRESKQRQQRILDAHYEAANLPDLVKELKHLSKDEQASLEFTTTIQTFVQWHSWRV